MHIKTSNEIIKEYTLDSAKKLVSETLSKVISNEVTTIGDWEYSSLKKLISQVDNEFVPEINMKKILKNKPIKYTTTINWSENKNGKLIPYIIYNGNQISLKSFKNIKQLGLKSNPTVELINNKIKIIDIGNKDLKPICPSCYSNKLVEIDGNLYCDSDNCQYWFNHFYSVFTSKIEDKNIKKFLTDKIKYNNFNILSNIFNVKFINDKFSLNSNLKLLYNINIEEENKYNNYLDCINNTRKSYKNKMYFDLVSKHLKLYLNNLGVIESVN